MGLEGSDVYIFFQAIVIEPFCLTGLRKAHPFEISLHILYDWTARTLHKRENEMQYERIKEETEVTEETETLLQDAIISAAEVGTPPKDQQSAGTFGEASGVGKVVGTGTLAVEV